MRCSASAGISSGRMKRALPMLVVSASFWAATADAEDAEVYFGAGAGVFKG